MTDSDARAADESALYRLVKRALDASRKGREALVAKLVRAILSTARRSFDTPTDAMSGAQRVLVEACGSSRRGALHQRRLGRSVSSFAEH